MTKKKEFSIPKSHPRYLSLKLREQITEGVSGGLTAFEGLIAHGRGEAFDYLLGEQSIPTANRANLAASARLVLAENPVISVNGNVAALAASKIIELGNLIPAKLEINIFHFTKKRFNAIINEFKKLGAENVLGQTRNRKIPGLDHARAACTADGIYSSDVVLVPLEDGDRAEALRKMDKVVITIDLNPLSRTARLSNITIVDNVVRAIPLMVENIKKLKPKNKNELKKIVGEFDNNKNLSETLDFINKRLSEIRDQSGI
jgi:4-phosphopantoate--beta-alanine ligase